MTEYRAGGPRPSRTSALLLRSGPAGSEPRHYGEHPVTVGGSEITTVGAGEDPDEAGTGVELSVAYRSTHIIIRLRGEIDIATTPGLRERLLGLLQPGMGLVILDLSGVSFCDASGLGVLVGSHHHATMLGVTLRLTALHLRLARLLHIHGLDRVLTIYPALPDALT
jgi:anti-anti-sigma factor